MTHSSSMSAKVMTNVSSFNLYSTIKKHGIKSNGLGIKSFQTNSNLC